MGEYDEYTDVHVALQAIATQLKYPHSIGLSGDAPILSPYA
jgi:hypothetical protein